MALCLSIAWAASAQSNPGGIEGQVLDDVTNAPVRKALVRVVPKEKAPHQYFTTDENGRFSFAAIAPGTYALDARKGGYLQADYKARRPGGNGDWFDLSPGQKLSITLRLTPYSAISGRVVDEDGDPIEWVRIDVFRFSYGGGGRHMRGLGSAYTDDKGRYRVSGLPPGKYYLRLVPRDSPQQLREKYVPVYYPGTLSAEAASPIDLPVGTELENVSVKLTTVKTVSVSGRVSVLGVQAPSITVSLHSDMEKIEASAPEQGRFVFPAVAPGIYQLIAQTSDRSNPSWIRRTIEVGHSDITDLAISIPAPLVVTGRITLDGDSPANISAIQIGLGPAAANRFVMGNLSSPIAKDRTFRITGAAPDWYRITVWPLPSGFYLKSAKLGTQELPGAVVNLAGSAEVDLVLGTRPGRLSGTVRLKDFDSPLPWAVVVLIPQAAELSQLTHLYQVSLADASGAFSLDGVPPGMYKLFAWENVDDEEYYDPSFMRPLQGFGLPLDIQEGARQVVNIVAISAQNVSRKPN